MCNDSLPVICAQVTEGETYDGEWKYGVRHGTGTIHKNGSVMYQGEFLDDLRDGHGDGVLKDGSRYIGSWREGKMHGKGKMYPPGDEQGFEGLWEKGQLKEMVNKTGTFCSAAAMIVMTSRLAHTSNFPLGNLAPRPFFLSSHLTYLNMLQGQKAAT